MTRLPGLGRGFFRITIEMRGDGIPTVTLWLGGGPTLRRLRDRLFAHGFVLDYRGDAKL